MPTFPIQLFVESTGRVKNSLTGSVYYNTVNRIAMKRGDTVGFEVKFLQRGTSTPFLLPAGSVLNIAMKELNAYAPSTPYCCFSTTSGTPSDANTPYTLDLAVSGGVLDSLFTTPTQAFVDLMFELSWSEDGTNWNSTSEPIQVRVYNEVVSPAVAIPPTTSSLSLANSYRYSFLLPKNQGQEVNIDVQSIFGLKLGDIAQFKITMGMTPRKIGVAADYSAQCVILREFLACVDISDVGNYNEIPTFGELTPQIAVGTNAQNCGVFNLDMTGGDLPTPNVVFGQSTGLAFWYESVDSDPTRVVDLYDVVCFLNVVQIGVHNNWID